MLEYNIIAIIYRCISCKVKLTDNQEEKCEWCILHENKLVVDDSSTSGIACENRGRGCLYHLKGNKSIAAHQHHFCKYRLDHTCYWCERKLTPGISRADHSVKVHGTELTANIDGDIATVKFSVLAPYAWLHYRIKIGSVYIYMEIFYESANVISFYPVTVSDNRGGEFITIKATLTNPDTEQSLTTPNFPTSTNHNDWELVKFNMVSLNLLYRSKLDIQLTITVKK